MKLLPIIALLPLAFALAPVPRQNIPTPPPCAIGCLADITLNPAPCGGTDFVCFCSNAEVKGRIVSCLTSNCAGDQLQAANNLYSTTCTDAGAPNPLAGGGAAASASSAVASASSAAGSAVTADRVGPINTSASGAASSSAAAAASSVSSGVASAISSASGAVSAASSAVSASRSSVAASASSSSGDQPTALVKGFVAVGLGAAGVLGMM